MAWLLQHAGSKAALWLSAGLAARRGARRRAWRGLEIVLFIIMSHPCEVACGLSERLIAVSQGASAAASWSRMGWNNGKRFP